MFWSDPRILTAIRWLLATVALAAFVALSPLRERARARELERLPDDERHALFERTMATLGETCPTAQGSSMQRLCAEQARLARRFDECDAACVELATQYLPQPTR
jgi:hypothetical protein